MLAAAQTDRMTSPLPAASIPAPLPADAAANQPQRQQRQGQALMVAGGMLLGTIGVFVEEAAQDPAMTVWCRCAFGLVALLAWGPCAAGSENCAGCAAGRSWRSSPSAP